MHLCGRYQHTQHSYQIELRIDIPQNPVFTECSHESPVMLSLDHLS